MFVEVRKQGLALGRLTDEGYSGSHLTNEERSGSRLSMLKAHPLQGINVQEQINVAEEIVQQPPQHSDGHSTMNNENPESGLSKLEGTLSTSTAGLDAHMSRSLLSTDRKEPKTTLQPVNSTSCMPTSRKNNPNGVSAKTRQIQKLLLLNAYPIAYVLLWIPGILNRIVEATGHKSRPLAIMQASTQFIGFANAITYGYNEQIKRQLSERFGRNRVTGKRR